MSATQPAGYVLAFDLGTRTIGVAIGHREPAWHAP
jgi:RNase H-fold protein (predicted Holliday junction resolvase)